MIKDILLQIFVQYQVKHNKDIFLNNTIANLTSFFIHPNKI